MRTSHYLLPFFYENEKRNQQRLISPRLDYQNSISLDFATEFISQPSPEPFISSSE